MEISSIHNEIITSLHSNPRLPLPDDWISKPAIKHYQKQLEEVILTRLSTSKSIFGFKDPKTSILLPIWIRIFNRLRIVPVYILSVRHPSDTVLSLRKQYNFSNSISELFWLHKNCAALIHTGFNCFIAHYENWFTQPTDQARRLLEYTGLDGYFSGNIDATINKIIDQNLNRSKFEEYDVTNTYITNFYNNLRLCYGHDFDRHCLMTAVRECSKVIDNFKGWYIETQKYIEQLNHTKKQLDNEKIKYRNLKNSLKDASRQETKPDTIYEVTPVKSSSSVSGTVTYTTFPNKNSSKLTELLLREEVGKNDLQVLESNLAELKKAYQAAIDKIKESIETKDSTGQRGTAPSSIYSAVVNANSILLEKYVLESIINEREYGFQKIQRKTELLVPNYSKIDSIDFGCFSPKAILATFKKKFPLRRPNPDRLKRQMHDAWRTPGKNTILLPIRAVRHFIEVYFYKTQND